MFNHSRGARYKANIKQPPRRGQSPKRGQSAVPKVSSLRRFHCIALLSCMYVYTMLIASTLAIHRSQEWQIRVKKLWKALPHDISDKLEPRGPGLGTISLEVGGD